MKQVNQQILEFPKILERLANYAQFSASKELALALEPTSHFNEVSERQTETTEAVHLLSIQPNVSIGGARDVRPMVDRANRGMILLVDEFTTIRQTLISGRELQRAINRLAYPRLTDMAQQIEPCPGVINQIAQVIDERGEIRDDATSALARIRRELETTHGRLLDKLNRLIISPQNAPYLQDPIVTQRSGRYVIPLKAQFKGKIQGVIHDQSGSGATLFIEPLSTVDLNNRWRQLQLDETDEIRRILTELSGLVASYGRAINHTVAALANLDLAFAKAKYAIAIKATEPTLVADTHTINLISARHPLLNPKTTVPVDMILPSETRVLVITGPNTGGKTVSLKTVGLLAMMIQSGLWIPANEGSTLPVFNRILADIGDEQSIEQSLSTFSGHMTNIVKILAECDEQSLVIFDELGAGTDPIEGSALARAILSHLLEKRVTTFVATHYSELKAFAHSTFGVANASMEFDLETLAPTYRLLIGLPGASNAFAIAQRLGLPAEITDRARELVGEDVQQVEAMLAEIKSQSEIARQIREQAEQHNEKIQHRLADIHQEKQEILRSAREDARQEIKVVRQQVRVLLQEALATAKQKTGQNPLQEIDQKLEQLTTEIKTKEKPSITKPAQANKLTVKTIGPGDTVFVPQFDTTGELVSIQCGQAEVQIGHFRTTVAVGDLQLRKKNKRQLSEIERNISLPDVESPGMELDLRGEISVEALQKMNVYLDKAFLAQLPWVRIIHGKGNGVLRQAVRQELKNHTLISTHRPGGDGEGGEGVTVANLAIN
jgi:DNA mismatch repair protein MutS2